MTLPHAAYASAVHTVLAGAGIAPSATTVAVIESVVPLTGNTVRDLTITLTWGSGHSATWGHVRGWCLHRPDWGLVELTLPVLVDPVVLLAPIGAALAGQSGADLPADPALWADRHTLDADLAEWEATRS